MTIINALKVRLGDYLTVLTDYHANGSYEKLRENVTLLDIPDYAVMIRTTNFEKGDFVQDLKYINEHAYNFLGKSKVYPGDILMNKIASPGSVYRMPNLNRPVSLAMNLFLLRTNVAHLDQTFAYFWLKANEPYVKSFACGAATATITKNAVRELVIPLPPLSVQRKIATILSSYDDLIENNRRRIKILEEMAQNLYCEWFVKLHFPGHEKTKFLDSYLGRVPKGWEIKELSDFVDFERGVEPGSKNYVRQSGDDYVPFLRVGDLGKRESVLFIKKSLAKGRMLTANDIAVTMDGTVGLVSMGLEGAYSSGIQRVAPHADCPIGKAFIFQLLQSEHIQAIIEAHAKGTTIKHAGSSIGHMVFMLPEKIVADAFEEYVTPLLDSVLSLQRRDDVLRRTRDLLLPKLISGEFDVSELNITVPEEVAA